MAVTGQKQLSAEQSGNEAAVRKVLEDWAHAIESEDMAGLLAHHADDIVMYDVTPPLEHRGIDAYRKTWEVFFSFQGKGVFDLGNFEITAGDDTAFGHGIITCGTNDVVSQFPIRLTVGLRKIGGQWQVTHEHHSGFSDEE